MSSDEEGLVRANNVTRLAVFPANQEVIRGHDVSCFIRQQGLLVPRVQVHVKQIIEVVALRQQVKQDWEPEPEDPDRSQCRQWATLPPQLHETSSTSTPKIGVYAFGVVMLELLLGNESKFQRDGEEVILSGDFHKAIKNADETELGRLVGPRLEDLGMELAGRVLRMSMACLAEEQPSRGRVPNEDPWEGDGIGRDVGDMIKKEKGGGRDEED